MKLLLLCVLVFVFLSTSRSLPISECYEQLKQSNEQCATKSHDVFKDIEKLPSGEMSEAEVVASLELNCPLWLNNTICDLNFTNVHAECLSEPVFESYLNAYTLGLALNKFFCENEAEKGLLLISHSSATCLDNTSEEKACMDDLKNRLSQRGDLFSNENVCQYIDGDTMCFKTFTLCTNEIVKSINVELAERVKPLVGC